MRIHTLEHVPFEGPAALEQWARANGHTLARTPVYAGGPLPGPEDFDFLAVLGGPMSVHDETEHPWLVAEKALLRGVIETGKPMLGVCLGAQLFAEALGGEVTRNPEPEIGWLAVEATAGGAVSPLFKGLPDSFTAFHWHGDTFSIPPGAVHLARSRACANQAFAFGNRILGVQFHLETTPRSMELLLTNCADEIVDAPFVQDARQMRSQADRCDTMRPTLDTLLNNLIKEN
ncbi:GMP synthase [glutamine-hydrolyzing] [Pseudodesulfovibrio hydrargyri]|uniref:GMP synthase [glutamine-hydrolyzing] n=1 Tax=Pseudodesulfovibrio hydrargyri TaxID=2125990 RepID=A0A1J5N6T8_9BACT|nr:type 1 glutamine amidotransferase [Pseudodesulfovibrio hydrargyri]OIQ51347.1 GMP synthase [glutamine-hydrolyzing] [Pseudodesulfovibrio hydrargyri]